MQLSSPDAENPTAFIAAGSDTWNFDIGGTGNYTFHQVAFSNCTARAEAITAEACQDLGGNENIAFVGVITPGDPIAWTGAEDDAWGNFNNWNPGRIPVVTDVITIPAAAARDVVVSANDATVNSLVIEAGRKLTLNGNDLIVTNALTCAGSIVVIEGDERVVFTGPSVQAVDFKEGAVKNIAVEKTGGGITFASGFKVSGRFVCNTTAAIDLKFAPAKTVEIAETWINGYDASSKLVTMASSSPGSAWNLKLTRLQYVIGVNATDCDASSGSPVLVGALSTIDGTDVNWDAASSVVYWKAGNSAWTTAANWSSGAVPAASDHVVIAPKSGSVTVTSDSAVSAAGLKLGKGVTLSLNDASTDSQVSGDVLMFDNAVMTHSNGNKLRLAVVGDFLIHSNATITAYGAGSSYGTGEGTTTIGGSYGGRATSSRTTYGSVFEPTDLGSGAYNGIITGGGCVILDVTGTLFLDGTITVDGNMGSGYNVGGSGGSIYIKTGTLSGFGLLSSAGGNVHNVNNYVGAGGRIAIYQRTATDWSAFTGTIRTIPANNLGNTISPPGTVYRELPQDGARGGEILFRGGAARSYDAVDLPQSADGDAATAYKKARLVIDQGAMANITADMTVRDIDFVNNDGTMLLNGNTLTVKSGAHKNGANWIGGDYATKVGNGRVSLGDGGEIIWAKSGLLILIY